MPGDEVCFCLYFIRVDVCPLLAQDEEDTNHDGGVYVDPRATRDANQYMNEEIGSKKFDEKKWKETVGDLNFEEEGVKEEKDPTKKKEEKEKESDSDLFSMDPKVTRMISFIVVFCLFAFILYYVAQNTKLNRKKKIKSMTSQDAAAHVENIEELDTDSLLRQALQTGDLRMAVRIITCCC
ncbi:MAG: hypothetical protein WDO15_28160 [Bacteroidota bacterium]